MGRSRSNRPFYEDVEVIDVAAEGNAIAKVDDVVIFIKGVVPGDVVDIQVTKKRKNYREAKVVGFKKYSEDRVEPFCEPLDSPPDELSEGRYSEKVLSDSSQPNVLFRFSNFGCVLIGSSDMDASSSNVR